MHPFRPLLLLLLVAGLVGSGPRSAAQLDAAVAPIETTVRGHRVVVERVAQFSTVNRIWNAAGEASLTGQQSIYLHVAVHPATPQGAAHLEGIAQPLAAVSQSGRALAFHPYQSDDPSPLDTGVWRSMLVSSQADLSVSAVHGLKGEILVYPEARIATLDFPLDGKLPLTRTAPGLKVTLREVRPRAGGLSATVLAEWPADGSVARLRSDAPHGIFALGRGGGLLFPHGSAGNPRKSAGGWQREYVASFSELKEPPATLRMQVMVRSGKPERLPFTLPPIRLPDTLDLAALIAAPAEPASPPASVRENAARPGGTLALELRPATGARKIVVGVSRRLPAGWDSWRWSELSVGEQGPVRLGRLQPGRYRVRVRRPDGTAWLEAGPDREVEITPAADTVLGVDVGLEPVGHARWPLLPAPQPKAPVAAGARPAARAGEYEIRVDRISHGHNVLLGFGAGGPAAAKPAVSLQRTATVELSLIPGSDASRDRLALVRLNAVTVQEAGRAVEVPFYAGLLPEPKEKPALLRASVSVPGVPLGVGELWSLEGDLTTFSIGDTLDLVLPVDEKLPAVVEVRGVRATLRRFEVQSGQAQALVSVEAPDTSLLAPAVNDSTYGAVLESVDGRFATPAGGTATFVRPHQVDFRLTFQNAGHFSSKLRLRLLHRGGERRVLPFRLQRVPLPTRTDRG